MEAVNWTEASLGANTAAAATSGRSAQGAGPGTLWLWLPGILGLSPACQRCSRMVASASRSVWMAAGWSSRRSS